MPRFDKTGPQGQGPKTGRGMGECEKNEKKTKRGFGRCCDKYGRGMGRFAGKNIEQIEEKNTDA